MKKSEFLIYYDEVIRKLADMFKKKYPEFSFCDNSQALYEEYLNQKTMLRILYQKDITPQKMLLDRHKVCACLTVAIIKTRLMNCNLDSDEEFELSEATRINEQLAFMCSWELLKGFIVTKEKLNNVDYILPQTFHNDSFEDTITRSLFFANQLNSLSTPLLANIYYLLEVYCLEANKKNT